MAPKGREGERVVAGTRVPAARRTTAIDRLLDSVERVETVRVELSAALDELPDGIDMLVSAIANGMPVAEVTRRSRLRRRRRLTAAIAEMSAALAENRVLAIRVMVDEEGLTMASVARLLEVPRQVVSRLYHGRD